MKDEDTVPELPDNWTRIPIGKVVDLNPQKPSRDAQSDNTEVTFVPMMAVDDVTGTIAKPETRRFSEVRKAYTAFCENDVIFAKITPSMQNGKAAIARNLVNGLGFGSTEFHVLRPTVATTPEYIYHYIRQETFRLEAKANMTGSVGQRRVPAKFLRDYKIPLPPLPEQRRIVAKIEEFFTKLDAGINELKAAKERLERCRQSVLNAAVKGRLTEEWREEHKDELGSALELLEMIKKSKEKRREKGRKKLPPLNTSKLSELPEVWTWVRLEDISKITMGQAPPSSTYNTNGNGLPFFQGSAEFGNICPTPTRWCSEPQKTSEKGDILISVRAPPGPTNICPERSCIGRGLAAIKGLSGMKNKYILYVLRRFEGDLASHGTTIEEIRRYELRSLAIPLPPSLEQQKIVEKIDRKFSVIRESENIIQQNLKRSERFRQSILKRAFEGKLVPQDPSDEPAEKLLERIKAEKVKQEVKKS